MSKEQREVEQSIAVAGDTRNQQACVIGRTSTIRAFKP